MYVWSEDPRQQTNTLVSITRYCLTSYLTDRGTPRKARIYCVHLGVDVPHPTETREVVLWIY